MLDTPKEESKWRNWIRDNTIHSPVNHISVSSSLDGTLQFASDTCASMSQGKAQIPDVEVEEDNATLMEAGYGEDETIGTI